MISRFLLRLNQIAHANGATVTYGKDPDDMPRPASITTTGAATSWATGTYAYDGAGNVKKIGTVSPYESFIYDTVSRLTSGTIVTGGVNRTQTASFDAFGFMTTLTTNGGSQTFTPVSGTNHISGPGYDAGGAMTTWGTYTYEWDRLGQMAAVAGSITRRTFLYTAGGERIEERVGADALNPTSCVLAVRGLDGKVLRLYTKTSGTWSWSEDYVYRNGAALASVTSAGTKHLHLDHLGSIRRITGTGTPAAVVATHDYYPFGMEATDPCQDAERMEYHGLERDQQGTCSVQTEDLDYAHARFASPILARFMSIDPVRGDARRPQSFNLYAFVQSNPMTFTDPLGLAPAQTHIGASAGRSGPSSGCDGDTFFQNLSYIGVQDLIARDWWSNFRSGTYWGTGYGRAALEYYGSTISDPGASGFELFGAYVGGFFSALWTPETYVETYPTFIGAAGYSAGSEVNLGSDIRIAPFGNRTGSPTGELPHYHRRWAPGSDGRTPPGGGIGRHRPWDSPPLGLPWWKRF